MRILDPLIVRARVPVSPEDGRYHCADGVIDAVLDLPRHRGSHVEDPRFHAHDREPLRQSVQRPRQLDGLDDTKTVGAPHRVAAS